MNAEDQEKYLRHVRSLVDKNGYMIQAVGGDGGSTYYYTVGLTKKNLNELIVTLPIDPHVVSGIIKSAVYVQELRGAAFGNMSMVGDVLEGLPVLARTVEPNSTSSACAVACCLFAGVRATHLILPDPRGLFPGQFGFNAKYDQNWLELKYSTVVNLHH
jgi:hypothetical protein